MSGATLVTGADGYVGRLVISQLLDRGDNLVLAVRADNPAELACKRAALSDSIAGRETQVTIVCADLRESEPFAAVDPTGIEAIVHAGSVVRFNVDEATARAVNVDGVRKLQRFAGRCRRLEHLVLLSTIYSAGRATGVVAEDRFDRAAGFVNYYEWSKWAAEELILADDSGPPTAIVRIATIAADNPSGRVTQLNAFHHTLRMFFYGLLSLVPGAPTTPVYLVTGDVVRDAITQLLTDRAEGIFHVSPARADTCTLEELVDTAFEVFEEDADFKRRRILRPLYCDRASFDSLVAGSRAMGGSPLAQTLASMTPFVEQLYLHKDVRNDRLAVSSPEVDFPDPTELAKAVARELTATRWHRNKDLIA